MPKITKIWTHQRPHADEFLGIVIWSSDGRKKYPGVEKATLKFCSSSAVFDADDLENQGALSIGVGRGRFDEHPSGNAEKDKAKEGKCAATLVAEDLGVQDRPEWKKVLAYVTQNDLKGNGNAFDICYLLKRLYEFVSHQETVGWMLEALRAIRYAELQNSASQTEYDHADGVKVFDRLLSSWLVCRFGEEISEQKIGELVFGEEAEKCEKAVAVAKKLGKDKDPALKQIFKFAKNDSVADDLFSIKGMPALIWQRFMDAGADEQGRQMAIQWTFLALDIKYQEQKKFLEAGKEFAEKAQIREFRQGGKQFRLAVVDRCDNSMIDKYARSKAGGFCAATIKRATNGNVQIFTNKYYEQIAPRLVENLVVALRKAEQEARGEPVLDESELQKGNMLVAFWFHHVEGKMLLNGSDTAVVDPTRLALDRIADLTVATLGA